jgi:hypothetical protein
MGATATQPGPYRAGASAFARLLRGEDTDMDAQRMLKSLWRGENYPALAAALELPDRGFGTACFLLAEGGVVDRQVFQAAARRLPGESPRVTSSILEGLAGMMAFADADTVSRIRALMDDQRQNDVVRKYARRCVEAWEGLIEPR